MGAAYQRFSVVLVQWGDDATKGANLARIRKHPAGIPDADDDRAADAAGSRNTVQSLAKGFRVLEAFSPDNDEMTLSEVAKAAGLDPGTTFRLLTTLVDLGYVGRAPESRRFSLTAKVLDLGFRAIARRDIRSHVRPVLRHLVGEINEAASYAVLDGSDVVFIERVRAGLARLGIDIGIGTVMPAAHSVVGLTILAFLSPDERERVLAIPSRSPFGSPARSLGDDLPAALADVRANGYALMDSLIADGLRLLAVPVLNADGYPVGALSVVAPAAYGSLDALRVRALPGLRAAAADIARALEAAGTTVG